VLAQSDQVAVVVRQKLFAVVPASENAFTVRVVCDERDERASTRHQERHNTSYLCFRLRLFATELSAARLRARVG